MDAWNLIEHRWPFANELAEVEEINRRFGLAGDTAFSQELRPVFFVGDLAKEPRVLLIGLKPGLNSASNIAFQAERRAIGVDFETYKGSRVSYFLSESLNRRYYRPLAKAVATVLGEPFPFDPGNYLAHNVVEADLLPFFAAKSGLTEDEFISVRETSEGGKLAAEVLHLLLQTVPWEAIVVRYHLAYRVFCRLYDAKVESSAMASVQLQGRTVPVYELAGRYLSDDQILRLGPGSGWKRGRPSPAS